jgi:hypothetical protein
MSGREFMYLPFTTEPHAVGVGFKVVAD